MVRNQPELARSAKPYKVVIADDDEMVLGALRGLLDGHPALEVVAALDNGRDAAELCAEVHPDLVILDVMMECGGVDGVTAVKAASPSTVVAFYTAQADKRTCRKLIEAGGSAVFAKGAPLDLVSDLLALVSTETASRRLRHDTAL